MEDVLDLYEEDYYPRYPTVCLNEKPVVLHAETQPIQAGCSPWSAGAARDYEYVRRAAALRLTTSVLARPQVTVSINTPYSQSGAALAWSETAPDTSALSAQVNAALAEQAAAATKDLLSRK